MDSMVSLGTLIAYLASLHQVLIGGHHFHFEDAVAVLAVLTVGRYLEARSKEKAALSVEGLIDLFPHRGRVVRNGQEEEIPAEAIAVGDEVAIRPGEKAPIDGLVLDGRAEADEALLTGESLPLSKSSGDRVIAGSLILGGRLVVRAERTGEETTLAGILKEMERIGAKRSGYQDLADRVIRVFMPIVLATAILSFLGWWLATGEIQAALRPAIAVMIIACPCALGIAIPVAISVGAGAAARKGILIRDPAALDAIPGLGVFVFDKTGSVTTGRLRLAALRARGLDEAEAFRLAAAVERGSEHPIAEAFRVAMKERGLESIGRLEDFRAHPGEGVEGRIAAWRIRIGRPEWCGVAPGTDEKVWLDGQAAGRILFAAEYRREDGAIAAAWFALEDAPRPEAAAMIAALKRKGLKTVLLTGDREATAARVGAILGFDAVRAEVRPAEKAAVLRELRAGGGGVAMLGDGVNDAPALAEADLGIAMGSGAAIAAEAGSIVLLKDDLSLVPEILRLGDLIRRKARQNLFWAFFYNTILIPAAAFGVMPPMAAAMAMALSDVTVIGNALLLWRFARR
jgi:Cu+-exporting ATPase